MQFTLPPVPLLTMGDFSNGGAKVVKIGQTTKKSGHFLMIIAKNVVILQPESEISYILQT